MTEKETNLNTALWSSVDGIGAEPGRWETVGDMKVKPHCGGEGQRMSRQQEIEQERVLAQLMVDDLDRLYKKYQKSAYKAQKEREAKRIEKEFKGCKSAQELQDLYGYGDITIDELERGIEYFRQDKVQYSTIELHRKNIKELRDRWRGTVNELKEELNELLGVEKLSYVEELELSEREERYKQIL